MPFTSLDKLLDAVVATTTSEGFNIGDRTKQSLQFICANRSSGNGVFTVDVSNDGTNWTAYNRLTSNLANSNVQADTRVASVTLNANGSNFAFFPEGDHFNYIRVTVTRTTDGTYSAILSGV